MTDLIVGIYGGVDTHKDLHVAAVADQTGRVLGTESFAANPAGYRRLAGWICAFGPVVKIGIEGTSSYGVGLTRHLLGAGIEVVEVIRPNRQVRRRRGKSDTVDAEAAARAALSGEAATAPKGNDGIVESIRALRVALCSTRSHRTRVANQIRDLINTAPEQLRCGLEPLTTPQRAKRCARFRPGDLTEPVEATKAALRTLARQHLALSNDLDELRGHLEVQLTAAANPALRAAKGIGAGIDPAIAAGTPTVSAAKPRRRGRTGRTVARWSASPTPNAASTKERPAAPDSHLPAPRSSRAPDSLRPRGSHAWVAGGCDIDVRRWHSPTGTAAARPPSRRWRRTRRHGVRALPGCGRGRSPPRRPLLPRPSAAGEDLAGALHPTAVSLGVGQRAEVQPVVVVVVHLQADV